MPKSSFLDAAKAYFSAQVRSIDFDAPSAAPTINAWVSDNTAGRIKAIVPNPIPPDVRMYLVNAVYFKGSWSTPFDSSRTHPQPFHLATGDTTYGGQAFSMTIVLPPTPSDIDSLVRHLTDNGWSAWTRNLAPASLFVSLPRFTISSGAGLNRILSDLGMRTAFCGRWVTDFTKLDTAGQTCIDDVQHGAWVQVNEEGTAAAAATSVGLGPTSLPPHIVLDRPFLFAIRERFSGAILFLGKVMNPPAS